MDNPSKTKQVIVIRRDLSMPPGKVAAQASHASLAWLTARLLIELDRDEGSAYHHAQLGITEAEKDWLDNSFTKVVLGVDSEEELLALHSQATEAGLESHLITDAGYTQFLEPTNTALGIGPDWNKSVNIITGHLSLL